jgi:purine-binding chemotaxis protein CheW
MAEGATHQFLTFRVGARLYALPAQDVAEVIRTPPVARLPQSPASLLGLANLRGEILPLASVGRLLGRGAGEAGASARAIVLNGAAPVALAVDSVEALLAVEDDRVETRQAVLAADPGERLTGAFQAGGEADVARILDIQSLLAGAFTPRARTARKPQTLVAQADVHAAAAATQHKLVTFEVAGQEFALALEDVREIVPAPETLARSPHSEALVLGVAAYRGGLLPMLSLRGLLGFPMASDGDDREKVVVTIVGGVLVGLVADRMRSILSADPHLIDPTPPLLAARSGGESRIKAIYRGEAGRRLVSILSPEQLFREDVMQRLGGQTELAPRAVDESRQSGALRFLVFRLGDDDFGLPIEAVDEVANAPAQVTRVPKTPKFLEGVVNLRGEVLPVVDQRKRFEMPALADGSRRRLIVVRTAKRRAGLIVDAVSEVVASSAEAIEPAPDLTGEANRLVNGVINLEAQGRIVLLLDPDELLSRSERGLLDSFQAGVRPKK